MPEQESNQGKKPSEEGGGGRLNFEQIITPIWAARKQIAIISLAVAVITLIVNFLLPVYYKATATLLPETEKSKLSALGQFADVAQLAGVSIPGSEISRLYPAIISSETILRNVIERTYPTKKFPRPVNLIQYFELDEDTQEENMDKALKNIDGLLSASYENRTGIVTVTVEMREPELAADVVNAVVGELDKFMRLKKISNASEQLKWIDVRLKEVQADLRKSEEVLKDFREKNRRVLDSPQLLMEQDRLAREVQVNSTIFIELKKQYELAKLEEIKNITIVNVLDPGRAPVKKNRPKRLLNTVIFALFSLIGVSWYYTVGNVMVRKFSSFSLRGKRSTS